jgi:hypothetical protein
LFAFNQVMVYNKSYRRGERAARTLFRCCAFCTGPWLIQVCPALHSR